MGNTCKLERRTDDRAKIERDDLAKEVTGADAYVCSLMIGKPASRKRAIYDFMPPFHEARLDNVDLMTLIRDNACK